MWLDSEEICNELWEVDGYNVNSESEFSDDSDCDSDMVVKFLSGSKHSDGSGDDNNVKDDNDMHHGTRTKVGVVQTHFPFCGNLGVYVA